VKATIPVQDAPKRHVSKGKSAVTRALLKHVSEGNKQIARVPFFDSSHPWLSGQARTKVRLNPLSCGFMILSWACKKE